MKTFLGLTAVLGLVSGTLGLKYWKSGPAHPTAFRCVAVDRDDLVVTISATGTVQPEEIVDVGAQVVGRIKSFGHDPQNPDQPIDYGSVVEEGTVLAEIDGAIYQAAVDQARADRRRAEAEMTRYQVKLSQAEADWQRAEKLLARKAISQSDYEKSLAAHETAKAELEIGKAAILQAEAALRQAETSLGYVTIRSPIQGVVIDRRVNVGQTVVSGLNAPSLFLLAKDLRRVQVWASVNEADIGEIHVAQAVSFSVDAYPGVDFQGQVTQVRLNASMSHNIVTYTVIVSADNPHGKLLPYMTANLQFEVARRDNVLVVPNHALRWRPSSEQIAPQSREQLSRSGWPSTSSSPNDKPAEADAEDTEHGTLWVEAAEGLVRPVAVRTGLSNGLLTELVEADLERGTKVVVGQLQQKDDVGFTSAFVPKRKNRQNSRQ